MEAWCLKGVERLGDNLDRGLKVVAVVHWIPKSVSIESGGFVGTNFSQPPRLLLETPPPFPNHSLANDLLRLPQIPSVSSST